MSESRYCVVFDYETDGLDTNELEIVQIGAVPLDLKTLEVLSDETFAIDVKPPSFNRKEYVDSHQEVINWHANVQGCSASDVIDRWDNGTPLKDAFTMFIKYCNKYKSGNLPLAGGQNILNFDIPITKRFCNHFNQKYPFRFTRELDLKNIAPLWLMFSADPPKNDKMDTMRDFFGIAKAGGHDALKDVIDTGDLIKRFLSVHKTLIKRVPALYKG